MRRRLRAVDRRSRAQALKQRSEKEAGKDFKDLVHQAAYITETAAQNGRSGKSIAESKEMCFVVTDIEGSTQLSVAGRAVYDQLLAIHDQLMREGIAKFNGTQIVTEGDSFLVAFPHAAEAVAFCQDLQCKLLDTPWPKAVLRLPGCEPIPNEDGDLVLQGPRVRMGVHWALPGLVACRPHALTKAPMVVGIAVSIAQEISDAAHGGQVLLSQEAWNQLRGHMARAGFPIVRRLGLFEVKAEEGKPYWLYTVEGSLLRPIKRQTPPPRKLVQLWPPPGAAMAGDWGLYVTDPPVPLPGSDDLTFVSLRLRLPPGKRTRRRRYSTHANVHRTSHHQVPSSVLLAMQQLFVKHAQQFGGYMFGSDALTDRRGYFSFGFGCPSNALRFCHTVQVGLMYSRWLDAATEYFGQAVVGIDGRLVFKGPRVAAGIHRGSDYDIMPIASYHPTAAPGADYCGPDVELARALADAAHGGQVLMTEEAWHGVQELLQAFPSALYTINLGLHTVAPEFRKPRYLLEVLPTLLSGRSFKPPSTLQQLELGYREAPSAHEPMTMVFAKVAKPTAVTRAEATAGDLGEEQVLEAITAYQLAVGQYGALARSLLPSYGGYECKEPEPGKFTMAFGCLTDAIAWACHVQKDLLQLDWPPALLRMQGCEEVRGDHGQRLWRGLRVRVGMAFGYINVKKPMNTGRADYFGELANTAARVAALAAPGQILIESSQVDVTMPDGTTLLMEEFPTYLPVKWAASGQPRLSALAWRNASEGGALGSGSPLSSGFVGADFTGGGSSMLSPLQQLLMPLPSKRRMSLLEVTTRSLSLGAQQLLAMRRRSRNGSITGGEALQGLARAGSSSAVPVEHIELRALGRFLLRGLDNPKVLYQALPDTLLERTYAIATDALVSMPESSVTMRADTQRRGGLLALLRRKVMGGATRATLLAGDGAGGRRRRGAAADDAAKLHADDNGNASTDDGLTLKPGLRHASDLANQQAHRAPSALVRAARHHSTINMPLHGRALGVARTMDAAVAAASLAATEGESAMARNLRTFNSIASGRGGAFRGTADVDLGVPGIMRRSITSPRAAAAAAAREAAAMLPQDTSHNSRRQAAAQAFQETHTSMPLSLPASGLSDSSYGSQQRRTQPGTSSYRQPAAQRGPDLGASGEVGQGAGGRASRGEHRESSPRRPFTEQGVAEEDIVLMQSAGGARLAYGGGPDSMSVRRHQIATMRLTATTTATSNSADSLHVNSRELDLAPGAPADAYGYAPGPGHAGQSPAAASSAEAAGGGDGAAGSRAVAALSVIAPQLLAARGDVSGLGGSQLPGSHGMRPHPALPGLAAAHTSSSGREQSDPLIPSRFSGYGSTAGGSVPPRRISEVASETARALPIPQPSTSPNASGDGFRAAPGGADSQIQTSDPSTGPESMVPRAMHASSSAAAMPGAHAPRSAPWGALTHAPYSASQASSPTPSNPGAPSPVTAGVSHGIGRPGSPYRDRAGMRPSPLGGAAVGSADSFTGGGRRPGRSMLGPHYLASLSPATGGRVGSISDMSRLAPPPRALQPQLQPAQASGAAGAAGSIDGGQPSVTVRLHGMSRAGSEANDLGTAADSAGALLSPFAANAGVPLESRAEAQGPGSARASTSLRKMFLGTLANWTRKSIFGEKPSSATRGGPQADGVGAAASSSGGGGYASLPMMSSSGGLNPAHTSGTLDLRVRAVLRAANAQAATSEGGSREQSQSGSVQPGDSFAGAGSAGMPHASGATLGDGSTASSPPHSQPPAPVSPSVGQLSATVRRQPSGSPKQPLSLWQRIRRGPNRRKSRRVSDTACDMEAQADSSPASARDEALPSRMRMRGPGAMRATASVSYPAGGAMAAAARASYGDRSMHVALATASPSGSGNRGGSPLGRRSGGAGSSLARQPAAGARSKAERAMASVMRGVRVARAMGTGGGASISANPSLAHAIAAAAAGGGSVYSPPGSGRSNQVPSGSHHHSHSSSASSMYSGTASPRMTMSGNEQHHHHHHHGGTSGGVATILASVFGRGGQPQRKTQHAPQMLSTRYRRRSAHIVLSEAARLELMQRSAAAGGAMDDCNPDVAEGGQQTFAAAVARTYVQHRRQQQQQQLLQSGGLASASGVSLAPSGALPDAAGPIIDRVSSNNDVPGSYGHGDSFSTAPPTMVSQTRLASSMYSGSWAAAAAMAVGAGIAADDPMNGAMLSALQNAASAPAVTPGMGTASLKAASMQPSVGGSVNGPAAAAAAGQMDGDSSRFFRTSASTYGRLSSGPLPQSGSLLSVGHMPPASSGAPLHDPAYQRALQNASGAGAGMGSVGGVAVGGASAGGGLGSEALGGDMLFSTEDAGSSSAFSVTFPKDAAGAAASGIDTLATFAGHSNAPMPASLSQSINLRDTAWTSTYEAHGVSLHPAAELLRSSRSSQQHQKDSMRTASLTNVQLGGPPQPQDQANMLSPSRPPGRSALSFHASPTSSTLGGAAAGLSSFGSGPLGSPSGAAAAGGVARTQQQLAQLQRAQQRAQGPARDENLLSLPPLPVLHSPPAQPGPKSSGPIAGLSQAMSIGSPGAEAAAALSTRPSVSGALSNTPDLMGPRRSAFAPPGGGSGAHEFAATPAFGHWDVANAVMHDTLHVPKGGAHHGHGGLPSGTSVTSPHPSSAGYVRPANYGSPAPTTGGSSYAGGSSLPRTGHSLTDQGVAPSSRSGMHPDGASRSSVAAAAAAAQNAGPHHTQPISPSTGYKGSATTPAPGQARGPRIITASLPGPSHPLYYNTPMSEWAEPEALAAMTSAAEAVSAQLQPASRRVAGFGRKSNRGLSITHSQTPVLTSPVSPSSGPSVATHRDRLSAPTPGQNALAWAVQQQQAQQAQQQQQQPTPPQSQLASHDQYIRERLAQLREKASRAMQEQQQQHQTMSARLPAVPYGGQQHAAQAGAPSAAATAELVDLPDRASAPLKPQPSPDLSQWRSHQPPHKSRTSPSLTQLHGGLASGDGEAAVDQNDGQHDPHSQYTGRHIAPAPAAAASGVARLQHLATFRTSNHGLPEPGFSGPFSEGRVHSSARDADAPGFLSGQWQPPGEPRRSAQQPQFAMASEVHRAGDQTAAPRVSDPNASSPASVSRSVSQGQRHQLSIVTPPLDLDAVLRRAERELVAQLDRASSTEAHNISRILHEIRRSQSRNASSTSGAALGEPSHQVLLAMMRSSSTRSEIQPASPQGQGSIPEEPEHPGHAMRASRPPALDVGSTLSSPSSTGVLTVLPGSVAGASPGSNAVELSPMARTPSPAAARQSGEDAEAAALQARQGRAAQPPPPQQHSANEAPTAPHAALLKRDVELSEIKGVDSLAALLPGAQTGGAGAAAGADNAGGVLYSPFASTQALSEDLLREVSPASARRITRASTGSGQLTPEAAVRDAGLVPGVGPGSKAGTPAGGPSGDALDAGVSGGDATAQSRDSHCTTGISSSAAMPHSSFMSSDAQTVSTGMELPSLRMSHTASGFQRLSSGSGTQHSAARLAVPTASGLTSPPAAALAAASSPPAGLRPLRVPSSRAAAATVSAPEGGGNRPPRELSLAVDSTHTSAGGADAPSEALPVQGVATGSTYSNAIGSFGLMLDLESGFGSPLPSFDVITGAMMRPLNSMGSAGGSTVGSSHGRTPFPLFTASVLPHSQSVGGAPAASLLAPDRVPLHSGGTVSASASLAGLMSPAALLPPSPPGSSRRTSHLRPAAVQALLAREMSGGSPRDSPSIAGSITAASLADGMVGSPTGDTGAVTGSASVGGGGGDSASSQTLPSFGLLRGGSGRAPNTTGAFSPSLLGRRLSQSTGHLDGSGEEAGSFTMATGLTPLVLGVVDARQRQGQERGSSTAADTSMEGSERESAVETDAAQAAAAAAAQATVAHGMEAVAARSDAAPAAVAGEGMGEELQAAGVDNAAAHAAQSHAAAWRAAHQHALAAAQISAAANAAHAVSAASARSFSGRARTAAHGSSFGGDFRYDEEEDDNGEDGDASLSTDGDRPSAATVNFSDRTSAFSLRSMQSVIDRTSAFSYLGPSASNTASGWASERASDRSMRSHLSASARASRDLAGGSPYGGASRTSAGEGDGESELSVEEQAQMLLWRRPQERQPGSHQGGAAAPGSRAAYRSVGQRSFTANTRPGPPLSQPMLASMFGGGSAHEAAAAGARVLDQRRSRSLTVRAGAAAAADDRSEPSSSGQATETGAVPEDARLWQEPPFPHMHARSGRRGGSSAMNFGAMSVVPEIDGEENSGAMAGRHSSEVSAGGLATALEAEVEATAVAGGAAGGQAPVRQWDPQQPQGRVLPGPIRLDLQAARSAVGSPARRSALQAAGVADRGDAAEGAGRVGDDTVRQSALLRQRVGDGARAT
ncbi:hypothetical protein HXX76_008853 [Chlamydomonas incerta]|uniref:Guanylate cyclase domain-containing protein n=1 Tax=Chlamydomonas incerta TaxID=51695 RepID=A0A835W0C0_CHLIN|nr:hypothetical protein HXX76_008853 [Chlamydomonas incerta]|eukprot:KAG2432508.1 hypothetical protein HXX76_008853 [Chlamydomonas incerta]